MNEPLIVLAAGGTGGHVFPAEALATELLGRGCRLALFTDRRGGEYGGKLGELETLRISAGGIAGKGPAAKVVSAAELIWGTWQAHGLLKRMKPKVVVGFGGYASVPTMMAAILAGIPSAVHEQNAVLGRANRLLASRVQRIAASFSETRLLPDGAGEKIVHTGMPVRAAVAAQRDVPYPALEGDGPIRILVLGGSQGASILSEVVPEAMARLGDGLRQRVQVAQQCRPEDLERVRATYAANRIQADLGSFFDDVPARLASAHLLIARAGASTVAEATAVGRPAILVPYPHATDDHQTANAHAVDAVGAGWLIGQDSFTPEYLSERLNSLLGLPAILTKAAENAKRAGRPEAVKRLADMVFELLPQNGNGDEERRAA